VHALAQDDGDDLGALAEHHHVQGLAGGGDADFDFLVVQIDLPVAKLAALAPRAQAARDDGQIVGQFRGQEEESP